MEEISRSVRQVKQAKFLDADCTYPYSPYGDVAGSYHLYNDVSGGVMWHTLIGLWLTNQWMTPVIGGQWCEDTWSNPLAPCVAR
jgi:hypothetical protein